MRTISLPLKIYPVTAARWRDFEVLFGERGACGGCWCMWWRLTASEYDRRQGAGNMRSIKKIITTNQRPGLIAYADGQPVGWIAIAPRTAYPRLDRSRVLARVDDRDVWSVTCFFVARPYRRKGVTTQLLRAAIDFARRHQAKIVEGYPVEAKAGKAPDPFVYTGLPSAFMRAGFTEVLRRSETRPIMRYLIK